MKTTLDQRLTLYDAYDAQEPDAKAGLREALEVDDDTLALATLMISVELDIRDYDGLLAALRRAAVGMPVPDDAEIEAMRQMMRGAA